MIWSMTNRFVKKTEVRCPLCSRKPLLGILYRDDEGRPVLQVKAHKQNKILAEVIITGAAEVRCRECLAWHSVEFADGKLNISPKLEPGRY